MGLSLPDIIVNSMRTEDWESVRAIYIQGIATGTATFEQTAPEWKTWDAAHLPSCRLIARKGSQALGWAALSPYSRRQAYAGVAEVSVYVAEAARGRGVGAALLSARVTESERQGIWTLQASIFPENTPSIRLHERSGFRVAGTRERIGYMDGRWRDVVLMERRTQVHLSDPA
jgi:phosphinothricin acetyltransferase